jgi:hypothetical protein
VRIPSLLSSAMLAVLVCGASGIADAHHSIAMFDHDRTVSISGTVSEFRWINPHAVIEIDGAAGDAGLATHWVVQMQAPNMMLEAGWSRDTLKTGDRVTVFANPLRATANPGSANRLQYVGIILPDGRTLGRTGADH